MTIRNARSEDARGVAAVLAQAFPSLYRSTFGALEQSAIVSLLHALYEYGHLPLEDTRVCEIDGTIVAVMILHTGLPIGRGSAPGFWRLVLGRYGYLRAPRIVFGGIMANVMLNRRIPCAPDLVYIEALAVSAAYRGQGIGSRLLADAEEWALSHDRSRLALHVLVDNAGARRLYKRAGFRPWHEREPESRWQSSLPHSAWAAILMLRVLGGE